MRKKIFTTILTSLFLLRAVYVPMPAQAVIPAIAAPVIASAAAMLTAAGISFFTTTDAYKSINSYLAGKPELVHQLEGSTIEGANIHLSAAAAQNATTILQDMYNAFKNGITIESEGNGEYNIGNWISPVIHTWEYSSTSGNFTIQDMTAYALPSEFHYTLVDGLGNSWVFENTTNGNIKGGRMYQVDAGGFAVSGSGVSVTMSSSYPAIAFALAEDYNGTVGIVLGRLNTSGNLVVSKSGMDRIRLNGTDVYAIFNSLRNPIASGLPTTGGDDVFIPTQTANRVLSPSAVGRAIEQQYTDAGEVIFPYTPTIDATVNNIEQPWTDSQAQQLEGSPTAELVPSATWDISLSQEITATREMVGELTQTISTTFDPPIGPPDDYSLPDLSDIFPFCIPFDLAACLSALNASPQAPRFTGTLNFPIVGTIDVDINLQPWDDVAAVTRKFMFAGFVLALIAATRLLIKG